MMEGGPSHIDTFDPKPMLEKLHLKEFVREGKMKSAMESGKRYYVQSPFQFRKPAKRRRHRDELGASRRKSRTSSVSIAAARSTRSITHRDVSDEHRQPLRRRSGDRLVGELRPRLAEPGPAGLHRPARGQRIRRVDRPTGATATCPRISRARRCGPRARPFSICNPPAGITREHQRANLDLLAKLNDHHAAEHPGTTNSARMRQLRAGLPHADAGAEAFSISKRRTRRPRKLYGIGKDATDAFGRKCLLARKLVEKGRALRAALQRHLGQHDYIERAHGNLVRGVDQPIAALIADLRSNAACSTTRSSCGAASLAARPTTVCAAAPPTAATTTQGDDDLDGRRRLQGRPHHRRDRRTRHGSGRGQVRHVRDFHVTLLHLFGLDDNKLTFYHGGRFKQLSQFGGTVIRELIG
jgi:hypothetical protein